jgi:putative membrane protein
VPICTDGLLSDLSLEFFPHEFTGLSLDPRTPGFQRISPYYVRSRIIVAGLVPALLATATLWHSAGITAMVALLWIPVCAIAVWRKYRRYGVLYGQDGLALRSGLIGFRVVAWLHRKVQRVSITQSPFQRRRQLATVRIFLAAGSAIRIPYLEQGKAKALRDYVLYRVESSEVAWH